VITNVQGNFIIPREGAHTLLDYIKRSMCNGCPAGVGAGDPVAGVPFSVLFLGLVTNNPTISAALELAVKAAGETIESVDVFRAALEHVVAWVNAKASDVDWSDGKGAPDLSKRDQIAKVSGNEICINTAALTRALDDGGWLVDAMLSEWVQRGWAKRTPSV